MESGRTSHTQTKPLLRRAIRALSSLIAAGLLLGFVIHLGRTTLVEWTGKRAGLDWQVDQVEWSLADRSIELHGVQMRDDAWMATTDNIACTGISWSQGELNVNRIQVGTFDVTQMATPASDTEGEIDVERSPTSDWKNAWDGPLRGIVLHQMDWEEICVQSSDNPELTLAHVACEGLTCNALGVSLKTLNWSSVRGNLQSMDAPLELAPSSLQGSWSPEGWEVTTSTLSLPGLDVEGRLSWPEMTGRGHAKVEWANLPRWMNDMEFQGWLDTLQLRGENTTIAWDLDDTVWTANVEGPSWFELSAHGNANSWQGQVHVNSIPDLLKSSLPSDTLNLLAMGTGRDVNISLVGGDELNARMLAKVETNWEIWLSSPEPPESAQAFIDAWGPWVASSSDRVEARLDRDGKVMHLAVGQPQLDRPWSIEGDLAGFTLDVTAKLDDANAGASNATEATLHLELDSAAQTVTWQGTCVFEDLNDSLKGHGHVNWGGAVPEWQLNLNGQGAQMLADGTGTPELPDLTEVLSRRQEAITWGDMRIRGQMLPRSQWASWLMPNVTLLDTLSLSIDMDKSEMRSQVTAPKLLLADRVVTGTDVMVTAHGNALDASMQSQVHMDSTSEGTLDVDAHLSGKDLWAASLTLQEKERTPFVWKLEATPIDPQHWACSLLECQVPTPTSVLSVEGAPVQWIASSDNPFPSRVAFSGSQSALEIQTTLDDAGHVALNVKGEFDDLDNWTQSLDSALRLSRVELEGSVVLGRNDGPSTLLAFRGFDASYERINIDNVDVGLSLHQGFLNVFLDSKRAASNTTLASHLTWQPFLPKAQPKLTATMANLPIEWAQPWMDSTLVQLTGRLNAEFEVDGPLEQPLIQGKGNVDSLTAFVPNLGTHFGGHGNFEIGHGDLWLNNFSLYDALGNMARMEAALVHSGYEDWNFDASIVETPEPLLFMNLPEANNDVAFGQLIVGGSLDLFYWNGDLDIRGDLAAYEGTDLHLALLTEETEGWDNTVEFLKPPTTEIQEDVLPDEDELGVLIELNLETKRDAKITILTDPENNANIVGHTQGNLQVLMDDWEHMTLNGELDIVEGRYDLALGSLVRKTFVAKPGGRLFWNGDPYAGTLDLEAVYTTRANVQPLLGSDAAQVQNEDVEVLLQLTGPMMTPNLTFDLATPQAPPLVSEALASAVADPSEKTSQAIALLSLQEFLPPQYNSLELGSNGLQDYTVDVVTSQLSQWLSRFNDDIDIGIRYDAQRATEDAQPTSQQDALQVALRASFLNDRLEVEGAVGSREITQEALGETQLQNVRVLYHLNEDKSLQLTGFSEAQSSATQTANTTSQGVGIRWHRSFNWKWPWAKEDPQE